MPDTGETGEPAPDDRFLRDERALIRRAEAAFFDISRLNPSEWERAIVAQCGGDLELEREVRSLLAAGSRIGAFLERPALGRAVDELARDSAADDAADDLVGSTLGPFLIERKIASGGMGTVYLGRRNDGQFDQGVAIKVVKRGMDSEEIVERFRSERRTLAALDHPNIARLIDGGVTPDGRPFLAMEFVDGVPIDAYCDRHHLRVTDRIALFRQVCDAVHHAHQNLVIHRDLKPSNILVTPQGVPKLLDFGISKVLNAEGESGVTAEHDRRLTPDYASPEQIEGRSVTTASDVYSLGVVLYELLTGLRPYRFALRSTEELKRLVCEVMPPAPSSAVTVARGRPRPASTRQGNRGTEPEAAPFDPPASGSLPDIPATRGVSSTRLRSALRGDLDNIVLRALRKEPHRRYASAEQFSADLGRYLAGLPVQARRDTISYRASKFVRRHSVSVGLATLAVLLLAATAVVLYSQGQRLQRQRDELLATNRSLDETRRFLVTVLGGGEVGRFGPDATLGAVLREASKSIAESPPRDPLTDAAARLALGRAVLSLGMLEEARPLLESALRGFSGLEESSEPGVDAQIAYAELLHFEGRHAEAESSFRRLLSEERGRNAGLPGEREGLLLNDLGATVRLQGRADEALSIQREAMATRVAVHGSRSLEVAESHNNIGTALFQSGDLDGAIEQFTAALDIRRSLLRQDHPLVVRCGLNLGLAKLRRGDSDAAAEILAQSAESWERAFGPDHPGIVSTRLSLAEAWRAQERFDEALAEQEAALRWQREHRPSDSARIAATEAHMGLTLKAAGRPEEARAILERVVPIIEGAGSAFDRITASARAALEELQSGSPSAGSGPQTE